ncbi:MAG TPA: hypothetical protein PLU10_06055 [Chitinophagaceae bacterium]|nr:hypothetical protein [Chitinophagaceae bacterium]
MKPVITIYCHEVSARLRYITSWMAEQFFGTSCELITAIDSNRHYSALINYSTVTIEQAHVQIKPNGLLNETSIREIDMDMHEWNGMPIFFRDEYEDWPFDIFSAAFYLLSRYEEYLPYTPDLYQRFPEKQSLAFRVQFLNRPLIDEWMMAFRNMLESKTSCRWTAPEFRFLPTYDIDMAYSLKAKGLQRQWGGSLKNLIQGDFKTLYQRWQVNFMGQKDPFDCFDELDQWHEQYSLAPIYFLLLGKNGPLDKNCLPNHPLMKQLIERLQTNYAIGIHPSYGSHENEVQRQHEMRLLKTHRSRQHYIRFRFPETYRQLIASGIKEDYSMGYGSINGFRASTAQPFSWFDVAKNQQEALTIFPFCFMECNSRFEQHQSVTETEKELQHYLQVSQKVGGHLITIWHNFSLGSDDTWAGWRSLYLRFLANVR